MTLGEAGLAAPMALGLSGSCAHDADCMPRRLGREHVLLLELLVVLAHCGNRTLSLGHLDCALRHWANEQT